MSIIYEPSSTSSKITTIEYAVKTTGDRFFIPVNSDEHGGGDGDMADQLAQCQKLSPLGVESVVS